MQGFHKVNEVAPWLVLSLEGYYNVQVIALGVVMQVGVA